MWNKFIATRFVCNFAIRIQYLIRNKQVSGYFLAVAYLSAQCMCMWHVDEDNRSKLRVLRETDVVLVRREMGYQTTSTQITPFPFRRGCNIFFVMFNFAMQTGWDIRDTVERKLWQLSSSFYCFFCFLNFANLLKKCLITDSNGTSFNLRWYVWTNGKMKRLKNCLEFFLRHFSFQDVFFPSSRLFF